MTVDWKFLGMFFAIVAVGVLIYMLVGRGGSVTTEEFTQHQHQHQHQHQQQAQQQQAAQQQQQQQPAETEAESGDLSGEQSNYFINNNSRAAVPAASEPAGQNERELELDHNRDTNLAVAGCYPKDQLSPPELLPHDSNSTWAQVNPSGQGSIGDQNFLNAGFHVGINTVGQTLRNANLQLRSEPANPQVKVSPWLQTTIEPDSNRKPLEIGGGN